MKIKRLYVVGGQQRQARSLHDASQDWNGYERGLILAVDPATGESEVCVDYVSPPQVCAPEDPAITFQAGAVDDDKFFVCTQTEVMVYRLPCFELLHYISLPIFNDLHHARPGPNGHILVANAGLEQVLEITTAGVVRQAWHVLGVPVWSHVDEGVDYRRISTKPHRSHPNYISVVDEQVWVTRFHQGDATCLTDSGRCVPLSSERIHDGVLYEGRLFYTTVSGRVVIANPETLQVEKVIDVNEMHPPGVLLGWCRSLLVDGDLIWLGFSRIRPTKLRENVAWVARGFRHVLPTRIACYDYVRRKPLVEINMEPAGLNAIYSILPAYE